MEVWKAAALGEAATVATGAAARGTTGVAWAELALAKAPSPATVTVAVMVAAAAGMERPE